jgi:hypothetical protein
MLARCRGGEGFALKVPAVRAGEEGARNSSIEAETRAGAIADLDGTELCAVFVDPGARDSEFGGERAGIDESVVLEFAIIGAHQVHHAPRDNLHRQRVEHHSRCGARWCVGQGRVCRSMRCGHRGY